MRMVLTILTFSLALGIATEVSAASPRIVKVLPHFLDQKGRHTLSPSLYERDAYQAHLRNHPEEQSGLRFDVQWKSLPGRDLHVRLELRGRKDDKTTTAILTDGQRKRGLFSKWTSLLLTADRFEKFGKLTAWRATLLDGDNVVAEQKSFLWE